jgi:hypothetical protein
VQHGGEVAANRGRWWRPAAVVLVRLRWKETKKGKGEKKGK